jgi:hypothetical protein
MILLMFLKKFFQMSVWLLLQQMMTRVGFVHLRAVAADLVLLAVSAASGLPSSASR